MFPEVAASVVGASVPLLLWFGTRWWADSSEQRRSEVHRAQTFETIHIQAARIATDIKPKFDSLNLDAATITIIGSDGYYFETENSSNWKSCIEDWTSRSAHVNYILISPKEKAIEDLTKLKKRINKAALGSLSVYGTAADKLASDELYAATVQRYFTFHPTIIEKREGSSTLKAMWVESHHTPGSKFAYDVEFTHYRAMSSARERQFSDYKRDFTLIIKNSSEICL